MNILIVEDDELSRLALSTMLEEVATVFTAATIDQAISHINNKKIDLAFLDLDLKNKLDGLKILPVCAQKKIYSVVLSGHEEDEHVLTAYELGCFDFIVKPFEPTIIKKIIKKYHLFYNQTSWEEKILREFVTSDIDIIEQMKQLKDAITSERPIYIKGPTGTGKSALAKLIHQILQGDDKNFVHFNCSEIQENLIESELFGYEKGAFTGATTNKKGLLESAHDGTLFLDEIGTMPMVMQKKLLRVLEEKSFYPVGSSKKIHSNFRLISATCDDLGEMCRKGEFREDLFYRIEGFNIVLKSLSQRPDDILLLIKHFLSQSKRKIILTKEVLEKFKNHSWPGNVRELKKKIELLSSKEAGIISDALLGNNFFSEKIFKDNINDNIKSSSLEKHKVELISDLKNASEIITVSMKEVEEKKFNAIIESVEEKIVDHFFNKMGKKVRDTLKVLDISNNTFYRIYNRIHPKSKKPSPDFPDSSDE